MITLHLIFKLVMCHLVGDYILQNDYLASTKGENTYNLIVHCLLYLLPFILVFGWTPDIVILFISHYWIDLAKAKYKEINYVQDQILHYCFLLVFLLGLIAR